MSLSYRESYWFDQPGRRQLFYRVWQSETAKRIVVILHGYGEHGGRHQALARHLADNETNVYVPDLWGHGKSEGKRGHLGTIESQIQSLENWLSELLRYQKGDISVYLLGHSFGGLLAVDWAENRDFEGVFLESPLMGIGNRPPVWKSGIAAIVARIWPALTLGMNLQPEDLSRCEQSQIEYRQDPLVHGQMSAQTYRSIRQRQNYWRKRPLAARLGIVWGSADRIIDIRLLEEWMEYQESLQYRHCFAEARHELEQELDSTRKGFMDAVMQFVDG